MSTKPIENEDTKVKADTKQVSVRMPNELWTELQHARFDLGLSNSDFAVQAIAEKLDRDKA